MPQWQDRAAQLCYDGESIVEEVPLGTAGVVVTTHRTLAFTPEQAGANYRAVDRPNVGRAATGTEGSERALTGAVKALVIGGVLLGAGQVLELDGIVGSVGLDGTGQLGMGGMLSTLQTVLGLLALLDELMAAAGALILLGGALALGWYARSRRQVVRLPVEGGEDLVLPAPEDRSVVDRLDEAIVPRGGDEG